MDALFDIETEFSSVNPRVEFHEIQAQYNFNDDMICIYDLGSYKAQEGDRIAVYKLGWLYVKEYVLFEWVPVGHGDTVIFNKHTLPKTDTDLYQFCYISGDNEIFGASTPFQFTDTVQHYSISKEYCVLKSHVSMNSNKSDASTSSSNDSEREIHKLKEENEILKESIKMFMAHNSPKTYNKEMQELKTVVYGLRDVVNNQENDIIYLKNQIKVALECNRKLLQDKSDVERKYLVLKCNKNIPVVNIQKTLQDIGLDEVDYDLGELETIPPFPFAK